jgi:hypothetical protein
MDELFPVILGVIFGALIWCFAVARYRAVLSILAVLVAGTAATVLSGEYVESWIYILLDLGEAALGLALGMALAHWLQRIRISSRDRRRPL